MKDEDVRKALEIWAKGGKPSKDLINKLKAAKREKSRPTRSRPVRTERRNAGTRPKPSSNRHSGGAQAKAGNLKSGRQSSGGHQLTAQDRERERRREQFLKFVEAGNRVAFDRPVATRPHRQRRISEAANDWDEWLAKYGTARLPDRIPGLTAEQPAKDDFFASLLNPPDAIEHDRHFFIGIDAGTSGIRIGLYDEYADETRLYDFGENAAGGTRFSFPVIAAVSGGRLILGNDAVTAMPEERFVSFKAALIHEEPEREIKRRWRELGLPYHQELGGAIPNVADFLYSVSIARALELALVALIERGGSSPTSQADIQFAVCAPVDAKPITQMRFHRALACAIILAGSVGNAPRINSMIHYFAFAWEAAGSVCSVPPENQRLYVKSEAYSAIRSLRKLLKDKNNFLIADIGATTTDLSVIRVGIDRLACFAAYSIAVGVDTADSRYLSATGSAANDVLSLRLERHGQEDRTIQQREAYRAALEETAKELQDGLRRVMRAAVDKNPDRSSWERIHVVVAGGGSNIDELKRVFTAGQLPHGFVRHRPVIPAVISETVVVGHSTQPPSRNEAFELLSVLGTSTPAYEDIEYRGPDEIAAVTPVFESPTGELDKIRYMRWV